jgi:hypothetical protein
MRHLSSCLLIIAIAIFCASCPTTPVGSNNANLSNLTVSQGTLSPAFTANTTNVDLLSDVGSIVATGTKADSTATVGGNSGQTVALTTGNNSITITVTAQDGTTKSYLISVYRNGWDKWVDTSKGAVDTDLTFTTGASESLTFVCQSANLNWSKVSYHIRMLPGVAYTVSYTAQSDRITDLLSTYENNTAQYKRQTIPANTPTALTYPVTPLAGANESGEISFRPYPNLSTGAVAACTISITNFTITH